MGKGWEFGTDEIGWDNNGLVLGHSPREGEFQTTKKKRKYLTVLGLFWGVLACDTKGNECMELLYFCKGELRKGISIWIDEVLRD